MTAIDVARSGQMLGSRYVLVERIGRGAMGDVWQSVRSDDGVAVAVKCLRPELAANGALVDRFLQERAILLGHDHPNLARVLDLVVERDVLAIVMELVDGRDLRALLRGQPTGTLAPGTVLDLCDQVLAALEAVHANGVVHRDVKPENVLVERPASGRLHVRLTDFGIARVAGGVAAGRTTGFLGTPDYVAPEIVVRGAVTGAADLYSVGVLAYELLAGRPPFVCRTIGESIARHLHEAPARPADCPDDLWAVLSALLAKAPADRPATAAEARALVAGVSDTTRALPPVDALVSDSDAGRAVTALTDAPPAAAGIAPADTGARRPVRRRVSFVAATVVVVAVLVGGLLWPDAVAGPGEAPPSTARLVFEPVALERGPVVRERTYELRGDGSVLRVEVVLRNDAAVAVSGTHVEVVPDEAAASPSAIRVTEVGDRLTAAAATVVDDGLAFEVAFADLPPYSSARFAYDVGVADGAVDARRLEALASEQRTTADATGAERAAEVRDVRVGLRRTELRPGGAGTVRVRSVLANGAVVAAPPPGLAFVSSDPSVASVSRTGVVRAVAPGTATITASAPGGLAGAVVVTVVAPPPPASAEPPPDGGGGPGPTRPPTTARPATTRAGGGTQSPSTTRRPASSPTSQAPATTSAPRTTVRTPSTVKRDTTTAPPPTTARPF